MNIILTGFMGTGKSVAGKSVAHKLSMHYLDLDEMIEKDVGMKISKIFKRRGEPYFRDLETKACKCISILDNFVISTGGGVVLREENMNELSRNGIIICLTASPDIIYQRTNKHGHRPLLNVKDPEKEIAELLKKREPFYRRCDQMIDTSNLSVDDVVERIVQFYKEKIGCAS